MDLSHVRERYETEGLDESDVDPDPIVQFERWYRDAEAADLWEPNAMVVAVVDADGWPTARHVLCKRVDAAGFDFYTNHTSAKGRALDAAGRASLTFAWLPLRRQVRIQGTVERVPDPEADAYFATRPRGSQLGAWASPQSNPVADRAELEARLAQVEERFGDGDIGRPPHWGGYRVLPGSVEFWQGRPNRFHDRLRYRSVDGVWAIERLAP